MKPFKFRLQAALDMRRRKEEELKVELGQLQQRHVQEAEQLDRLIEKYEWTLRLTRANRVGSVQADASAGVERYLMDLTHQIETQRQLLFMVKQEVDKKRAEVVRAAQETSALENLRERHERERRLLEQREEQKFLDEMASIRAVHAMAVG
jgi:flagellar export protein FliJ